MVSAAGMFERPEADRYNERAYSFLCVSVCFVEAVMCRTVLSCGILSVLAACFLTGCENVELPFGSDDSQGPAPTADRAEAAVPESESDVPPPPPPPAAPTAESVLAKIAAKRTFEVTDADLRQFLLVESGLEAVTELELKGARLTRAGLEVLAKLPALKRLDLEGARIPDDDWSALSGATGLEWLNLYKSSINNNSLAALSDMTRLKFLDLSDTRVTDPGFVHLARLSQLERLEINRLGALEGSGLEHLGDKGARAPLKVIRASATVFGALGFVHIADFEDLEELHVGNASVTDASLKGLRKNNHIRRLELAGNNLITDQGIKLLRRCPELEILNLNGVTRISDVSFKVFGRLKHLKELRINDSACSIEAVEKFKKRHPDCQVYLRDQVY